MSELPKRLDRLFLKLDHMALQVEQILADALYAVKTGKEEDANIVIDSDEGIDRCEVEIERECIRLLALYQPAAIDLRRICFIIKANNDLERIADLCVNLARMAMILGAKKIAIQQFPSFAKLANEVADAYHQTIRLMTPAQRDSGEHLHDQSTHDPAAARAIIERDEKQIDVTFREYLEEVFSADEQFRGKANAVYALTTMGRALERLGDQCTNIAEDIIFLVTGEIVRHGG